MIGCHFQRVFSQVALQILPSILDHNCWVESKHGYRSLSSTLDFICTLLEACIAHWVYKLSALAPSIKHDFTLHIASLSPSTLSLYPQTRSFLPLR
jgi:hypothetical protein